MHFKRKRNVNIPQSSPCSNLWTTITVPQAQPTTLQTQKTSMQAETLPLFSYEGNSDDNSSADDITAAEKKENCELPTSSNSAQFTTVPQTQPKLQTQKMSIQEETLSFSYESNTDHNLDADLEFKKKMVSTMFLVENTVWKIVFVV